MFTGFALRSSQDTPSGPKEKPEDVLRFVKLTMLFYNPDRDRWEATIYDQGKGGAERKLNERILNKFTISDRYKNAVLEARVVKITEDRMVILAKGKFYGLRCGDMFFPAVSSTEKKEEKREMKRAELKALGIDPDAELKKEKKEEEEDQAEEG
jgi:hypothetical protein